MGVTNLQKLRFQNLPALVVRMNTESNDVILIVHIVARKIKANC